MTGRDLIVYILQNHLEDEPIFKNGTFIGFLTVEEAAVKADVGVATICAWAFLGKIPYVNVGTHLYIPYNFEKPSDM